MNDWHFFTEGAQALFSGGNPYDISGNFAAPWVFVLVAPLAWLPDAAAPALPWLALLVVAYATRRPDLIPAVGLSLPFVLLTWLAQVDWLALFGLLGVGYAAPLLLTVKPQATGLALVAYCNPPRGRYLVPLVLATGAAAALWGWPWCVLNHGDTITAYGHNWSLLPYTAPVGLWALWRAWRRGSLMWGCIASVALTPYLALYSLVPALVAVTLHHRRTGWVLAGLSWGFALL